MTEHSPLALIEREFDPELLDETAFRQQGIELPAALSRAVSKRKLEFLQGRACAAEATRQLGLRPQPVAIGPRREPLWPEGLVGAITHTRGYAAALVAKREAYIGVGIDAERHPRLLRDGLERQVCQRHELARIAEQALVERELAFLLIFSAKESLYKALYPSVGQYFGFKAAELTLAAGGAFEMRLCQSVGRWPADSIFSGAYRFEAERVVTRVLVPA